MNTNRIKGKSVLITGATSGIGKACAHLFAQSGSKLVLTGRRAERLSELTSKLEQTYGTSVKTAVFDVQDYKACEEFVSTLEEPVDILINNAGLASGLDPVYNLQKEDMDVMINTNVKGLLTMTKFISPGMKSRNSGHIINLSSSAAHEAYAGGAAYCASKHAVKAITEATKKDLHGTKVRVSMVSPGLVETEFSNVRFKGDDKKADSVYEGLDPLTAEDIAEIIFFVANRPEHVNILDSIIYPVYQSSPSMVHRDA